ARRVGGAGRHPVAAWLDGQRALQPPAPARNPAPGTLFGALSWACTGGLFALKAGSCQECPLQVRERRGRSGRPHIRPHHAATLRTGIRHLADFLLEIAGGGLIGHVGTLAVECKLPAMIHTAQPGVFVAAKVEGCPAMWTEFPQ